MKIKTQDLIGPGAYWGSYPSPTPLYCAWAEDDEARVSDRAENRNAAKLRAKEHFPNAKFFR